MSDLKGVYRGYEIAVDAAIDLAKTARTRHDLIAHLRELKSYLPEWQARAEEPDSTDEYRERMEQEQREWVGEQAEQLNDHRESL